MNDRDKAHPLAGRRRSLTGLRALASIRSGFGSFITVRDGFYARRPCELVQLAYSDEPALRGRPQEPVRLPANLLAEPDVRRAEACIRVA